MSDVRARQLVVHILPSMVDIANPGERGRLSGHSSITSLFECILSTVVLHSH